MLNWVQYMGYKLGGQTANKTMDSCFSFCHSSNINDTRPADLTSSLIFSLMCEESCIIDVDIFWGDIVGSPTN